MADNKQVIINGIKDPVVNNISQQDIKDFRLLQNAAKKFLNYMKNKKYLDFHSKSMGKAIKEMTQAMHHQKGGLILQQVYLFEEALNKFLERQIILTFVDDEGNLIFIEPGKKTRQYYKNLTGLVGSNGRVDLRGATNKYQAGQNLYEKYLSTDIITQKKQVYAEALKRFNKPMRYKQANKDFENTFYWRTNTEHDNFLYYYKGKVVKKYNKGHIAQAYADLVISRKSDFLTADLQNSLSILFDTIQLDSVIAAAKGDISQGVSDPVQFAIKRYNEASSAAVGPYIGIAYYLVYLGDNVISKEELKNKFDNIITNNARLAQSVLATLMDKTTKQLNKQFDKIQKQIKINL